MPEIQYQLFEDFVDFYIFKIFHGILFPVIVSICIPLNIGFVYYEYFGGDPLKRSLQNQFLSKLCILGGTQWNSKIYRSLLLASEYQ